MSTVTSLEHLLPAPDQSVRCADHSRTLAIDPGGTAIRADRVVLIETPRPWPKPVFDHPVLVGLNQILKNSVPATRTLAYAVGPPGQDGVDVGQGGVDAGDAHPATIITFDRARPASAATQVIERRFRPTSVTEAIAVAIAAAEDDLDALDTMADHLGDVVAPVLLVCTQGSHDVCCGSDGVRFAAEAESVAGLTVYRVSHTGGHRFAPTAMTLPDGRMWADMDLELLRRVLYRTGEAVEVADRCRGWWGAETGAAQVVERAVFAAAGWGFEDRLRRIEPIDVGDGVGRWVVTTGDGLWEVAVSPGRTVPIIACRQPGGLPARPALEYQVDQLIER